MSAGDILLFHRPTTWANFRADPLGTVMTTLIHLTTRSRWNHAALDIGDGLMVEATSQGVRVNAASSTDEIRVIGQEPPPHFRFGCVAGETCDNRYFGNDLEEVLAWATGRVGWRYGTLNAFWCGLRNLFPGVAHVKHGRTVICSELVAEALARAGHDWKTDYALVSPGDIADHFGVPRR